MELKAVTCPSCGGSVHIPDNEKDCFCTFCGSRIAVDDGSKTVTYRTVDEARLRELELEAKQLELDEKHRPFRIKLMLVLGVLGFVMIILGFFMGSESGDSNSPWYMVSMLGMAALLGAGGMWTLGKRSFGGSRQEDDDQ